VQAEAAEAAPWQPVQAEAAEAAVSRQSLRQPSDSPELGCPERSAEPSADSSSARR